MRPVDIRAMSLDQMKDELIRLKREQFNLRFQQANAQLENTARMRQVRRDIARIRTVWVQIARTSELSCTNEL